MIRFVRTSGLRSVMAGSVAGHECVREGALSTGCESPSGFATAR